MKPLLLILAISIGLIFASEQQQEDKEDEIKWEYAESRRFVLKYEEGTTNPHWWLNALETVYDDFRLSFPDLEEPSSKMVLYVLPNREMYNRFAKKEANFDATWTLGFYNAATNITAILDTESDYQDMQTARHEAAHHISSVTGIQRRGIAYPFWLIEGLAMSFETPNGMGASHINEIRVLSLASALQNNFAFSLDELLRYRIRPDGMSKEETDSLYAHSYSLFSYLYLVKRNELLNLLKRYRSEHPRKWNEEQAIKFFKEEIGPVEDIEKQLKAWNIVLMEHVSQRLKEEPLQAIK